MILGLISDTHDRIPFIEKAVDLFNQSDVEAVLHCGDFVSPFSLKPFRKLDKPLFAVFGNNDGEKAGLQSMFKRSGWVLNDRPYPLQFNGSKIAMLHEPDNLDEYIASGEFDMVVYGHTHKKHFEIVGDTIVVNPGEGCGWMSGIATVAFADLERKDCRFEKL